MPPDAATVTVNFRLVYNSANFIKWQLFYAGQELKLADKKASVEVKLGEYRQLRWYAVSEKSEEPYIIRIFSPAGHRLRYPGVPVAKVDPDIAGKMPKTPDFLDYSGWRRIKLEPEPKV